MGCLNLFNNSDDEFSRIGFPAFAANYSRYISEDQLEKFFNFNNKQAINVIHVNMRSLKKNFDKLESLLHVASGKLSVIAETETWLTDDTKDAFFLPGYSFVSKCRSGKIGGGVGMFIRSEICYLIRDDLCYSNDLIECMFAEMKSHGNSSIIIGCVYRPPSTNNDSIDSFNSVFYEILQIID